MPTPTRHQTPITHHPSPTSYHRIPAQWPCRDRSVPPGMAIAGVPLTGFLPPPTGTSSLLLVGGDDAVAAAFRRAGYGVDRHALDTGPLAQLAGVSFTPPAVTWPFPDAAYDAVVLLDELALTMREEE